MTTMYSRRARRLIVEQRPESCRDFAANDYRAEPAWREWLAIVAALAFCVAMVFAPLECYVRGIC